MSENVVTLEGELLKWAKNNEARKTKWLNELIEIDIDDLETLKKVAESSKWNSLVSQCSPVLGACMESWFADTFPQRASSSVRKEAKKSVVIQPIDVQLKSLGDLKEGGSFVDVAGLFHAGLAGEDHQTKSKRLFIRPASLLLLESLRKENYRALRVFGPPGIGKSCLVWAWACDEYLTRSKKVLWVHLTKDLPPSLVLLDENGIFEVVESDEDYVRDSNADIVVVDGVVGNLERHTRYVMNAFTWKSHPNRTSVQVASMQVRINQEDDDYNRISSFTMAPWTLEEFVSASCDDLFFKSVEWAFEGLQAESREDLISEKFYFAGCSARWMFNCTVAQVKLNIERHLESCPNSIDLLKGIVGQSSPVSVNHLWVGYPLKEGTFRKFFVSKYVARRVLNSGGFEAVKLAYGVARGLNNPSFTGWVVEMDFIHQLRHFIEGQVPIYYLSSNHEPVEVKWDVPGVIEFDFSCTGSVRQKILAGQIDVSSISAAKDSILLGFWLVPMKWNQGGYDVVRLLKIHGEYMLVFIQVTAAHEHSLKLKYFHDLASEMVCLLGIHIPRLQIIMLVPDQSTARDFSIPLSKVTNPGLLCDWTCGETNEKWEKLKEQDHVKVMWFDSSK